MNDNPAGKLRFLLLQVRNPDDPMRHHEVRCFARALGCDEAAINVFDLLGGPLREDDLVHADMLLLGGSGHYYVSGEGAWLDQALESLRLVHDAAKPTFASCWGFQAMARAMGGRVVHDVARGELGTHLLRLSKEGENDPLLGPLGTPFEGQMGHADRVDTLPDDALLLASSDLVENQAFCFRGKPIYCTQFHPELNREDLLLRVRAYPEYVERMSGLTMEAFAAMCHDTPATEQLLPRFVRQLFG